VQDEVSETVAEGERLLPELSVGEGLRRLADAGGVGGVAVSENGDECGVQVGHRLIDGQQR
jgi:hypothetical protein